MAFCKSLLGFGRFAGKGTETVGRISGKPGHCMGPSAEVLRPCALEATALLNIKSKHVTKRA